MNLCSTTVELNISEFRNSESGSVVWEMQEIPTSIQKPFQKFENQRRVFPHLR